MLRHSPRYAKEMMKSWIRCSCLIAAGCLAATRAAAQPWTAARPDGHAPLGVMADHTHEAGEWMLSFRDMHMRMDGSTTFVVGFRDFRCTPARGTESLPAGSAIGALKLRRMA